MATKYLWLAVVTLLAALILMGCGGTGDPSILAEQVPAEQLYCCGTWSNNQVWARPMPLSKWDGGAGDCEPFVDAGQAEECRAQLCIVNEDAADISSCAQWRSE
jgi:hypothetical protein